MIAVEPSVVREDGDDVVVDEAGRELVCRVPTSRASVKKSYHRIDWGVYSETGRIEPCCQVASRESRGMRLDRKEALSPSWSGCSYESCYGSYNPREESPEQGDLAARLESMTVEEFDRQTEVSP